MTEYDESSSVSSHIEYLSRLEQVAASSEFQRYYLWPRTPIHDIQSKVLQRVGATDYQIDLPHSRPASIIRQIKALKEQGLIGPAFSVLDIACGDAIVLWQIKRSFAEAHCFGVDCNKGRIATHAMVQHEGVRLYNGFIQHLFERNPDCLFDVVLMLNSYRGWGSADLREHERELPGQADAWFAQHARYTILTATHPQIAHISELGFAVQKIGKGEDNSTMICLSKFQLPRMPARRWIGRWFT